MMESLKTRAAITTTLTLGILLIAISMNIDLMLAKFGGRVQHAIKDAYLDHGAFKNDRCWTNSGGSLTWLMQIVRGSRDRETD